MTQNTFLIVKNPESGMLAGLYDFWFAKALTGSDAQITFSFFYHNHKKADKQNLIFI